MEQKNQKALVPDINVEELRNELKEMKTQITEMIKNDPAYSGEVDLFLCVIDNLSEEIRTVKNVSQLDHHKQARVLADVTLFQSMLAQMFEDEEGFEMEDEEELECDDEDCGHHHH